MHTVKLRDGYIAEILNIVVFTEMCVDKRRLLPMRGEEEVMFM